MLKKYLLRRKFSVLLTVSLVVVQVWSMLRQPGIIADVMNELSKVDEYGNPAINQDLVLQLGVELIVVGVIGLIAGILVTILAANISQKIGAELRTDTFRKIQDLSYQDVEKFSPAHLVVRMTNDITQIQNLIMMLLQTFIRVPFLFVGGFVLAIQAIPSLWWTLVLFIIGVGVIMMFSMKLMIPTFGKIQKNNESINTIVKENMDGVRVVKSFVTEEKEFNRFEKKVDEYTQNNVTAGLAFSFMIPVIMFLSNIVIAVAMYLVCEWAVADPALIGDLSAFTSYVMQIMFAIMMAGFLMMMASRAIISMKRVQEVFDTDNSLMYGKDTFDKVESIEFKNVSFKYPEPYVSEDMLKKQQANPNFVAKQNELVLHNISFSANGGEKIGVVGKTGSGKTTFSNLIPRLFDATEGEILINGKNINAYNEETLRSNISLVLQKAVIFSGNLKTNILQGKKDATEEEIIEAAKHAQAYEFINKKGLDAEIFQKGANLSGGQKQRLSISRALVKNPSILILDDSTSALDARSENLVKKAITEELTGITTFIIAQKISSVVDCDQIIVLEDGKVDAIGTHHELLKTSPVYCEIFETQKDKEVN